MGARSPYVTGQLITETVYICAVCVPRRGVLILVECNVYSTLLPPLNSRIILTLSDEEDGGGRRRKRKEMKSIPSQSRKEHHHHYSLTIQFNYRAVIISSGNRFLHTTGKEGAEASYEENLIISFAKEFSPVD